MEHAVAVQDVVVAERVEVPLPLEAARQPAEMIATLEHCDALSAARRQGISRGRAGQAAAEHNDRVHGVEAFRAEPCSGRASGVMAP